MSAEDLDTETLEELSARYAACPDNPTSFYDEALDTILGLRDEPGLSPELVIAVLREASLDDLTMDGWGSVWIDLCAWLPADPRPGGSWRLRAARAAAARGGEPSFGDALCARDEPDPLEETPTWTGNFLSPWAPMGLPHLEDFTPEERVEFLGLASRERLAFSLDAWTNEAALDNVRRRALGLGRGWVRGRRAVLLSAARDALARRG